MEHPRRRPRALWRPSQASAQPARPGVDRPGETEDMPERILRAAITSNCRQLTGGTRHRHVLGVDGDELDRQHGYFPTLPSPSRYQLRFSPTRAARATIAGGQVHGSNTRTQQMRRNRVMAGRTTRVSVSFSAILVGGRRRHSARRNLSGADGRRGPGKHVGYRLSPRLDDDRAARRRCRQLEKAGCDHRSPRARSCPEER